MADCPRVFCVNWFRKGPDGKYLWPGFGENIRILEWIINRTHGRARAIETPLGWMPRWDDIHTDGLNLSAEDKAALQAVPPLEEFKSEILEQEELILKMAGDLPKEIIFTHELLICRV